jgi:CheY-like chemotaxis protein
MATVLIADDHADSGILACRIFESAGHQCGYVLDGRQALSLILKQPPDLLVLDLHLPGLSGVELLEVVRGYLRLERMPVIVVTGNPDRIDPNRVRRLGVGQVLTKGAFTPTDLLDAAAKAMAGN